MKGVIEGNSCMICMEDLLLSAGRECLVVNVLEDSDLAVWS
jgi:hypothetical protein